MVAIDTQAQINLEAMIEGNEPYWELKKPYSAWIQCATSEYRLDSKCGNSIDQIHNGCKKWSAKEGQHCLHEL